MYLLIAIISIAALPALADNNLQIGAPILDRPTLTALGVRLPVTGDGNYNAKTTVRYRELNTSYWRDAQPLFRVHPETITGWSVTPHFAGSILNLKPGTTYQIQLDVTDPDNSFHQVLTLQGATRPVPGEPANPRVVPVSTAVAFKSALKAAKPGDIIQLAAGLYSNSSFAISASGTAANPIVIRGASQTATILDGGNCACNILEIYSTSYVTIENLTIRNGLRGIRFQTSGATRHVVRRVLFTNVVLGIGSRPVQTDFYIADNVLQGRLSWPLTVLSDAALHADDTGIQVSGDGHVVCHNRLSGFGDALRIFNPGSRAVDFYGNDVLWSYDNGVELDGGEGNVRLIQNRFTNTYMAISAQPILAGPAYILRNSVVNSESEPLKFHALASPAVQEPNGMLVYNNTFVSPHRGLVVNSGYASYYFTLKNNIVVGPNVLTDSGRVINWQSSIVKGIFDRNAYYPNGMFVFKDSLLGYQVYPNFNAMKAAGLYEPNGILLPSSPFASGLVGPATSVTLLPPQNLALGAANAALDAAVLIPNVNDDFRGPAPDLGAWESGCLPFAFGPRRLGIDENKLPLTCGVLPWRQ